MKYVRGTIVAAATVAGVAGVLALNPNGPDAATGQGDGEPQPNGVSESDARTEEAAEPVTATYTGTAYPTRWGSIQLAATVTDGVLTDITFVSLPTDSRSARINEFAAPALVEEALTIQSADVDTISGATWTSEGFRYSLQSILEQSGL